MTSAKATATAKLSDNVLTSIDKINKMSGSSVACQTRLQNVKLELQLFYKTQFGDSVEFDLKPRWTQSVQTEETLLFSQQKDQAHCSTQTQVDIHDECTQTAATVHADAQQQTDAVTNYRSRSGSNESQPT